MLPLSVWAQTQKVTHKANKRPATSWGSLTPLERKIVGFASSDTPNVGDHDGDMSETKLTERQQKILNLIKESPTITGKQMSETLSVSQSTIERDLFPFRTEKLSLATPIVLHIFVGE